VTAALDGYAVPAGHFDELLDQTGHPREWWQAFVRSSGGLDPDALTMAQSRIAKDIRDNTLTHSVYASEGRSRPWTLDPLPFVLTQAEWTPIGDGVRQLARLLNAIAVDVYGRQQLLKDGVLPPAVVFRDAGFLRPAHGAPVAAGIHLYQVAFDLARRPSGEWRLMQVRAQTPAGAGYALENRATILRMFPDPFHELHTRAIAPYFAVLRNTLGRFAPCDGGGPPHIVLLTPGPYSGRYFEHAYLARYFGIPLVEGADLTVRHDRVYLKTISGLREVHGVVRQVTDDFSDPLELRADSTLGVPGLLQVWRSGRVLVANTFGCGVLESAALRPYLPAACDRLLAEPLRPLAMPDGADDDPERASCSYAPVWHDSRMESRPLLLRVFAVATGDGTYAVMAGGLARIAAPSERAVTKGSGASKDTWVLSPAPIGPRLAEQRIATEPLDTSHADESISSRAAEHLFWLARYVERSDTIARLLRTALTRLSDPSARPILDAVFLRVCVMNGLLDEKDLDEVESAAPLSRRLITNLFDYESRRSLAFNVRHIVRVASAIRDRLSGDHWRLLNHLFGLVAARPPGSASLHDVLGLLERSIVSLAAVAGIEIAHMRRDYGWRFLSVGRHLERLHSIATTFTALRGANAIDPAVLEWLLDVSDSLVTFRARYVRAPEWGAVVELLILDAQNPRSIAFQTHRIARGVPQLPGSDALEIVSELTRLERVALALGHPPRDLFGSEMSLESFLDDCQRVALQLSDALTSRYFSHAYDLRVTSA
jgi:uncharacterized circularly permuted ATP-grasp superfamily protein/uncharacterized alpha-E superfamily protein